MPGALRPAWWGSESDVHVAALKPAIKRFQRLVLGYASDLQLDGSGRILIPPALRDYAKLKSALYWWVRGISWSCGRELCQQECVAALAADSVEELPAG